MTYRTFADISREIRTSASVLARKREPSVTRTGPTSPNLEMAKPINAATKTSRTTFSNRIERVSAKTLNTASVGKANAAVFNAHKAKIDTLARYVLVNKRRMRS